MNTYKVAMTLNKEQLVSFIDLGGPFVSKASITVIKDELEEFSPPRTRGRRGSKVNDAIMTKLSTGPTTVKELKSALEEAGLAPGSLSTGLALLQKSGDVTRIGDGLYDMVRKAAE